jgi:hypothetical protein
MLEKAGFPTALRLFRGHWSGKWQKEGNTQFELKGGACLRVLLSFSLPANQSSRKSCDKICAVCEPILGLDAGDKCCRRIVAAELASKFIPHARLHWIGEARWKQLLPFKRRCVTTSAISSSPPPSLTRS